MKKLLASDGALKIISVLIAIGIWVYIALVMNPAIEVTVRDLPIQFIGGVSLYLYIVVVLNIMRDNTYENYILLLVPIFIGFTVTTSIDMKTIIAKADISSITETGETNIPIEIVIPFENQGVSSQSEYSVNVKVEKSAEKTLDIEVSTIGTLAPDYMPGDIVCDPKKVTLSGPKSAVDKISKAEAVLNYNNEDVDIDTSAQIVFYGADNKEISMLDALMGRISISVDNVNIHCPVLKMHKAEVKAEFGRQELPENFSYKTDPFEVYVFGDENVSSKINEIKTEQIPLDKLLDNGKVKVKLIIPNGVKIFHDISEVEISIEK